MTDTPRIREAMAELQQALALLPELPCPAAPGECFCTGACQHPAGRHIRNAIRYLSGQTRRGAGEADEGGPRQSAFLDVPPSIVVTFSAGGFVMRNY